MVQCFDQLHAEGYLVSRPGSATRVATTARPAAPAAPARRTAPRPAVDFVPAVPDLAGFPREDWAWAVREATREAPSAAFGYPEPAGPLRLREVLASYLNRVRGAAADPGRIVTCTGFSQGLVLALQALAERGVTRVGFEDPGYDETGTIAAAAAGVEVVPVPVDEHGVVVSALAATRVGAVVLTPAHQWPTGVVLSPPRRHALAAWASDAGALGRRGRLRRRVPLRPRARRRRTGTRARTRRPDRHGQQVARTGHADRLAGLPGRAGRRRSPTAKLEADRGSPALDQLALADA